MEYDGGGGTREPIWSAFRAICGINTSFLYGDIQIESSTLGRGPPLFIKVNVFTLKKCRPVASCQGLLTAREGWEKEGEGYKKHFLQYKVLLLLMWSVEMYSLQNHGVYSHGDSAGVNSIFSLLKKVASCGGREQLRASELTLVYRC